MFRRRPLLLLPVIRLKGDPRHASYFNQRCQERLLLVVSHADDAAKILVGHFVQIIH